MAAKFFLRTGPSGGIQDESCQVLEQGRAWRKADAELVRARDRARYRVAAAEKKRLRALAAGVLEQRAQPERAPVGVLKESADGRGNDLRGQARSISAGDAVAKRKEFRARQPPRESAQDSVARWKELRARQGAERTPGDSISRWKEFRELERQGRNVPGDSNERLRGPGSAGRADDDEDERRKKSRSRDYDLAL